MGVATTAQRRNSRGSLPHPHLPSTHTHTPTATAMATSIFIHIYIHIHARTRTASHKPCLGVYPCVFMGRVADWCSSDDATITDASFVKWGPDTLLVFGGYVYNNIEGTQVYCASSFVYSLAVRRGGGKGEAAPSGGGRGGGFSAAAIVRGEGVV